MLHVDVVGAGLRGTRVEERNGTDDGASAHFGCRVDLFRQGIFVKRMAGEVFTGIRAIADDVTQIPLVNKHRFKVDILGRGEGVGSIAADHGSVLAPMHELIA